MSLKQVTAVVRVITFYFTALVLMLMVGGAIQRALGLPGVPIYQVLIYLGLPIYFVLQVERKPLKAFLRLNRLTFAGMVKAVILGLTSWFMVQQMSTVVILTLHQFGGEMVQPYDFLLDAPFWLLSLVGMIIPAIVEETSFRGYVLGALRPLGQTAAVIVTGLLFGMLHLSLIRLIPLSVLGIVWAYTVVRTNSIVPGMIMHFMNNGIALGLTLFVSSQGNPPDLSMLDGFPGFSLWVLIGFYASLGTAAAVAAYFLAKSFGPHDLADPAAALAAEEALHEPPEEAEWTETADLPEEYQAVAQELTHLRARRKRLLLAGGTLAGLGTLAIYAFAVVRELQATFH